MDFTTNILTAGNQALNIVTTLTALAVGSALLYGLLKIVFDLPLFNVLFGKGTLRPDGTYDWQSRYFPNCDPRQYIAMAVGILAAYMLHFQMWAAAFSIDLAQMSPDAVHFDLITTGITMSAGCKGVIYIVNEYKKSKAAIKELE